MLIHVLNDLSWTSKFLLAIRIQYLVGNRVKAVKKGQILNVIGYYSGIKLMVDVEKNIRQKIVQNT